MGKSPVSNRSFVNFALKSFYAKKIIFEEFFYSLCENSSLSVFLDFFTNFVSVSAFRMGTVEIEF